MSIRHARNRAEALIDSLGIKTPAIDVSAIAKHLNLPIIKMELGDGVSALLVTNPQASCIVVQESDALTRQRFSIAHEIGHYYLRHQFEPGEHVHVDRGNYVSQRSLRSSTGLDAKEVEANQFAACLLMPSKFIRESIYNMKIAQLTDEHIEHLANKFEVSEQAMAIRLSTLAIL